MAKINYVAAYNDSVFSAYLLELSKDCSCAKVQYSVERGDDENLIPKNPRWQKIKYNPHGVPFIVCNRRTLRLDLFMRTR